MEPKNIRIKIKQAYRENRLVVARGGGGRWKKWMKGVKKRKNKEISSHRYTQGRCPCSVLLLLTLNLLLYPQCMNMYLSMLAKLNFDI